MLTPALDWLHATARSGRRLVGVLALTAAAFYGLFSLAADFEAQAGAPPFDTQNTLTAAQLAAQLPRYTGAARLAYLRFAAFDFVFPAVAALFLAVWWAVALRQLGDPWAGRLRALPLLAFTPTVFDYLENVCLLGIVSAAPATPASALVTAALTFKQLKLTALSVGGGLTLALTAAALVGGLWRRLKRP